MNNIQYKLEVERTNLWTILISLIVAVGGLGLLFWANNSQFWVGHEIIQGLIKDLGNLTVVSVAIAFIWELVAKRAFVDELLTKARISQELSASGIVQIAYESRLINWDELFSTTRNLDVLFIYGKNWRGTHESKLNKIASTRGSRIRIVLPDPENEIVVKDVAKRINKTESAVRERILEAKQDFSRLRLRYLNSGSNIEIWYSSISPTYTIYRFDFAVIINLYSYFRDKNSNVPHFVAIKGGNLYNAMEQEFETLIDNSSGLCHRVE